MPYDSEAINLPAKFAKFSEPWSPKVIAQVNELHVKAAKLCGEFIWHSHGDSDELFIVHKGTLAIHYRDRIVTLGPGELHVVPKGVEHKPVADEVCEILMIEPAGTMNTGAVESERTVHDVPWI